MHLHPQTTGIFSASTCLSVWKTLIFYISWLQSCFHNCHHPSKHIPLESEKRGREEDGQKSPPKHLAFLSQFLRKRTACLKWEEGERWGKQPAPLCPWKWCILMHTTTCPGQLIICFKGKTGRVTGTSQAAPMTSGVENAILTLRLSLLLHRWKEILYYFLCFFSPALGLTTTQPTVTEWETLHFLL